MAKDARALREEAAEATASGKHKRALAAYLELERLEPRDAQWAKRAGETYRRLGNTKNAVEALARSADRYAQNGFLVQAMAVCKMILQIDPQHADTLRRLATMNEQRGTAPTRAATMAENNPALHEDANVQAIRRQTTAPFTMPPPTTSSASPPRAETPAPVASPLFSTRSRTSTPPSIAVPRTKSKPITMTLGAPLETVDLRTEIADAYPREHGTGGVHVIPIDEDDDTGNVPLIEVVPPDEVPVEIDEATELELEDIEEIPLPEPRAISAAALRALQATPLFAGLPSEALEALVENLELVPLDRGSVLFREGDPGDALYVIVEGEVAVQAEGPPRVEMARLGPGSFIGEIALMTEQPRSATITAVAPAELLRIDRVSLARVLAGHGDVLRAVLRFVRDRLVDRWMRTSPLFRPLSEEHRAELSARFTFLEIEDGTRLLAAGQRADGLYIILSGNFVVQRQGTTITTLGSGDLLGETSLLSGAAFKSDVIARGKALALCLPANLFRELIMTHPHVLEYIGEQAELSRRLQIL